jgi:hypothetical protein
LHREALRLAGHLEDDQPERRWLLTKCEHCKQPAYLPGVVFVRRHYKAPERFGPSVWTSAYCCQGCADYEIAEYANDRMVLKQELSTYGVWRSR